MSSLNWHPKEVPLCPNRTEKGFLQAHDPQESLSGGRGECICISLDPRIFLAQRFHARIRASPWPPLLVCTLSSGLQSLSETTTATLSDSSPRTVSMQPAKMIKRQLGAEIFHNRHSCLPNEIGPLCMAPWENSCGKEFRCSTLI